MNLIDSSRNEDSKYKENEVQKSQSSRSHVSLRVHSMGAVKPSEPGLPRRPARRDGIQTSPRENLPTEARGPRPGLHPVPLGLGRGLRPGPGLGPRGARHSPARRRHPRPPRPGAHSPGRRNRPTGRTRPTPIR